jgi:DNA-directed RNA polymerase specialized sigma24 family protein
VPQSLQDCGELLHKKSGVSSPGGLIDSESRSPFYRCSEMERVSILEVAGEHCTKRQRVLLILHYGLDLSLSEIAGEFGVSRSAATHMHTRALRELQEALLRMGIHSLRDV